MTMLAHPPLADTLADVLPLDMLELPRWLVWKRVQRGEGKPTKVPYNARTGRKADVTDAATWATFSAALAAYRQKPGRYAGVGFVLGDGISGVDLDACREPETGELAPWALAIVRELAGYAEVSPSGTGVHIIARGALPAGGRRRGPVELYEIDRFFTVTGEALADGVSSTGEARALPDRTDALAALHARIFASIEPRETPASAPRSTARRSAPPAPMHLADSELILKAHNARNGADFARVWSGDTSGYPSASEADMGLVRRLSFWVGPDAARIDALYRQSGMYATRARKWDSRRGSSTWGAQLIETVLASPGDYYTPPTASPSSETARAAHPASPAASASGRARADRGGEGSPDEAPADTPAPSPIELATRRRGSPDRGPTGGDTGEPGAPDAASVYTPIPGTPWYLASDGGPLMERKGRSELADFTPVYEWDAPTIHARVKFPTAESVAGLAVLYDIELDGQREMVSYGELHKGAEAWEKWGGALGIAGRAACANMAATVGYLARRAPLVAGSRATGWALHPDTGAHVYKLPTGALIGASGPLPGEKMYLSIRERHKRHYEAWPIADGAPGPCADRATQAASLAYLASLTPESHAAGVILCAHLRSIMYGIWASNFILGIRGPSGIGKTALASTTRNILGDFTGFPEPPATASFMDTKSSIEVELAEMKSIPLTVDDLAIGEHTPKSDVDAKAATFDMLARSVGNNTVTRERMGRDMRPLPAHKIDGVPVLTMEKLPPALASALTRTLLLQYDDFQRALIPQADRHAPGLRALGWGFVAYLAGEWDTHGEALTREWQARKDAATYRIERDVCAARGVAHLAGDVARLPSHAGHILLAASVFSDYCASVGIASPFTPETLYPHVLAVVLQQLETLDALALSGEDGDDTREFIAATIREGMAGSNAFVTAHDGTDATQVYGMKPEQLGYHAMPSGDYVRGRVWLGEITPDGEYLTLDRLALHDFLRVAARNQRRGWHVTPGELAATLHKLGLLARPKSGRNLEHVVRREGHQIRRLVISCAALWPDYSEPDGEGEPIELAPDGGPTGGAPAVELAATRADALADTGASYSPDTVTYAPDTDAEDGRERAGWGDEDADAAPYAPSELPTGDDPPDSGALAPVGELHRRQTGREHGETIREPDALPIEHYEYDVTSGEIRLVAPVERAKGGI